MCKTLFFFNLYLIKWNILYFYIQLLYTAGSISAQTYTLANTLYDFLHPLFINSLTKPKQQKKNPLFLFQTLMRLFPSQSFSNNQTNPSHILLILCPYNLSVEFIYHVIETTQLYLHPFYLQE